LQENKISYSTLWYIFNTNDLIKAKIGARFVGLKILSSKYNQSSWSPRFDITGNVIKTNGADFYQEEQNFSITPYKGVIDINELPVSPLEEQTKKELIERGKIFARLGKGAHYMHYTGALQKQQWWSTNHVKADGRVMVDCYTFCRMNPNYRTFSTYPPNILHDLHEDQYFMCWPTIGGFSFAAKKWGELLIDQLGPVVFDDGAYARLVFPPKKKQLIQSLVENSDKSFNDIITGKGGGCIFLLHGAPGTGKTLTAEAIAELLRTPLYSVSVGELGTDTTDLEEKLREILELATVWKAVILIDEADIFLEKRSQNDVRRNAMVGVFLRLLEYHQGILFLTTNRVKCFDEAFHSRISVALKYEDLLEEGREAVWKNLFGATNIQGASSLDYKRLADFDLNGRQIRTTIRLAESIARADKTDVTIEHIRLTIQILTHFKHAFK